MQTSIKKLGEGSDTKGRCLWELRKLSEVSKWAVLEPPDPSLVSVRKRAGMSEPNASTPMLGVLEVT